MGLVKKTVASGMLIFGLFQAVMADTLNLVIEPSYPPARSQEVYEPLVRYLNENTPHTINLITPKSYNDYWQRLEETPAQLSLDEAHIAGYRIEKMGFDPLVKTFEDSRYTLIIGQNVTDESLRGLLGRRIATLPSPSLGYITLTQAYNRPLQQPIFASVAASWLDTIEVIFDGSSDAAIVPEWLAQRYPNLYPIYDSPVYPGRAVLASPDVDQAVRDELTQALLKLHDDESAFSVLAEMNISRFEPANGNMYRQYASLLKSVVGY